MTSDRIFNNNHQFDIINSVNDDDEEQLISLSSNSSIDDQQQIILINKNEIFNDKKLNTLYDNWLELDAELRLFETKHKIYVRKLDEVESLKTQYRNQFDKYKKKIFYLQKDLAQLQKIYNKKGLKRKVLYYVNLCFNLDGETKKTVINPSPINLKNSQSTMNLSIHRNSSFSPSLPPHIRSLTSVNSSPTLDKLVDTLSSIERLTLISDQLNSNSLNLSRISDTLPRKDSYLRIILGGVDVSILNKIDKWKYKEEYEKFKFIVTFISLISSLIIWSLTSRYRAFDALFHFLLVWYYCTLTIRESILIVNGSNINRKLF
jgi:hypothetical protein